MKFAFLSLDFRRFSLEHCFQMAQRYGFDGLEIWAGRPHAFPDDMDQAAVRRIREWKRTYNIEVPMFTANILGSNYRLATASQKESMETLELYRKHIDTAAAIGCPSVLAVADHPGYEAGREEMWKVLVENLVTLADYGKERGVTVTAEPLTPMESPLLVTAEDGRRLLAEAGRSNLDVMLDVVVPCVAQEPISNYFHKLSGHMNYVHICNTDGCSDAHNRFGTGVLPVLEVLEVIRNYGYQGYVTVEMYSEMYRDPELILANTARLLQSYREELGV